MEYLCKYFGGSKLYAIDTEDSDTDNRGIFINTEAKDILSLTPPEHRVINNNTEDSTYYEIRRWMIDLKRGKSHALEGLFAD